MSLSPCCSCSGQPCLFQPHNMRCLEFKEWQRTANKEECRECTVTHRDCLSCKIGDGFD